MDTFLTGAITLFIIFFVISWIFLTLAVYFIPVIIAVARRHKNISYIAILNTFLGWTFFGWLASLLWACNSDVEKIED